MDTYLDSLCAQMKVWRAYCHSKGKAPHPMHLEMPTESAFSTFHACQNAGINGKEPNVGPMPGRDYSAWMDDAEDEIVWPSNASFLNEYDMVLEPSLAVSSSSQPLALTS